mmetsp:Transcript_10784/g.40479  ORF Transcript_10784/g.40479 Transcript_10784/m.40479 type:complete len:311 (+) Transcript_10784:68-1000(+)
MSERDDKYRLVQQRRTEVPIGPGEVRITQSGRVRHYITYALRCFRESASPFVTLRAMGRAISKAVSVAEVLKRRVAGLHQITALASSELVDIYEPLEEGLDTVEHVRYVSCIIITLTKEPSDEQKRHPGYQEPVPASEVREEKDNLGRRNSGSTYQGGYYGRGGRADRGGRASYPPRGRGRGRSYQGYRSYGEVGQHARPPLSSPQPPYQGSDARRGGRGDRGGRAPYASRGGRAPYASRGRGRGRLYHGTQGSRPYEGAGQYGRPYGGNPHHPGQGPRPYPSATPTSGGSAHRGGPRGRARFRGRGEHH